MNLPQPILPFYFQHSVKRLFACLHEPSHFRPGSCAVLICQPMGHEYVNSHRALRQLAVRLTENGFPVLRFDYYGTGDSSGNTEDSSVKQCLEDISSAIVELKRRTGRSEICLIGLRLGATLALLASIHRGDIGTLVLWDPVKDGEAHLQELLQLQKRMLQFHPKQLAQETSNCVDILGFRFSRFFTSELEQINLLATGPISAKNVLIMRGSETPNGADVLSHLEQSTRSLEEKHMPEPAFWQPNPEGALLVPARLIQAIVSWCCGASS